MSLRTCNFCSIILFAGIGCASKYGILIKGSSYVEKLNKANVFIFDKTGTLTKGNFVISKIYPENKKDEILKYAAICEYNSNHPIALAIKNHMHLKLIIHTI